MSIGKNIRRIRRNHGVSQWQLSQAIGLSPGAMRMIENGSRKCTSEMIKEIASVLDVSEAEIRGNEGRR